MNYDLVIPVGPNRTGQFKLHIPYILKYIKASNVYVVSNHYVVFQLSACFPEIIFIDENKLGELNLATINEFMRNSGIDTIRAGWYLQQFIKMYCSQLVKNEFYLVWDIDTVPLKNIVFFNKHKVLLSYGTEYHKPYFKTMHKILNLSKSFDKSFITEHMMFNKVIMTELIDRISLHDPHSLWYMTILRNIDIVDLSKSGFSEFETYGTFLFENYPNTFEFRKLSHLRTGVHPISKSRAFFLKFAYDTVSYENRAHIPLYWNIYKYIRGLVQMYLCAYSNPKEL